MVCCTTSVCAILVIALAVTSGHGYRPEVLPTMAAALDGPDRYKMVPLEREPKKQSQQDVCLTEGCVHAASNLLKKMDLSVDPCDDFYQFVCGKFRQQKIPDEKSSLTTFSVINDELQDQLRTIVDAPVEETEPRPFVYAKRLFRLCMNKTDIERVSSSRVKELLKSMGGWPVLEAEAWDDGAWNWKKSVYDFRKNGFSVDYFIDFSVGTDLKNSTRKVIDLDQASLGLSREYLIKGMDHKLVKAYYSYMVDIAVLFGADRDRAEKELQESLQFEMALANISLPVEERRNATKLYNPMSITQLQSTYQTIPWREYLSNILPPEVPLKPDEVVIITVPTYIQELQKILSHTPKRIQANYALWRAAASTVSYLSDEFRDRQLKYATAVSGRTEREARWKECVDVSSSSIGLAVGSLYVRRFFKEDAKKSALEITEGIRNEMYKILETVDWMDDTTRQNALDKAKSMTTHIAYPDELLDNNKLIEFYQGLEITEDSYLEAILNLTKFGTDFGFKRLRKPVNKTEWITHGRPAVVNAYYSSIENSIQFPAGILQGTFFSKDRPRYMNYGAIGFVIGHEITHGFDDQGRQFDKNGNLVDWWAPETKSKYLDKASCIIYQYGNYTDSQVNMKLNGINTQGENIADNGGIKQAYRAYKEWVKQNAPEPRLPGLQAFCPSQMFWISAANTWCSTYRDQALSNRITTAVHSPGEFRVVGPLSNMEEFAEDFKCPVGSKMNPKQKCAVW
ncbi:hypothetical protein AAG570_004879 [Ranatra chinensis]|uniref:Neprilysin-2 n=1 Tax=Ranatra chinensis TaxID=642074 RepID=A0ABD0YME1_9HEMI